MIEVFVSNRDSVDVDFVIGSSQTLPSLKQQIAPKNFWLKDDPAFFWTSAYFQG